MLLLLWLSCVLGCSALQRKFWLLLCMVRGIVTVRSNGVELAAAAGGLTVVLVGGHSGELHHTKTTTQGSFSFRGHAVCETASNVTVLRDGQWYSTRVQSHNHHAPLALCINDAYANMTSGTVVCEAPIPCPACPACPACPTHSQCTLDSPSHNCSAGSFSSWLGGAVTTYLLMTHGAPVLDQLGLWVGVWACAGRHAHACGPACVPAGRRACASVRVCECASVHVRVCARPCMRARVR